jgi:hypothetical protein
MCRRAALAKRATAFAYRIVAPSYVNRRHQLRRLPVPKVVSKSKSDHRSRKLTMRMAESENLLDCCHQVSGPVCASGAPRHSLRARIALVNTLYLFWPKERAGLLGSYCQPLLRGRKVRASQPGGRQCTCHGAFASYWRLCLRWQ